MPDRQLRKRQEAISALLLHAARLVHDTLRQESNVDYVDTLVLLAVRLGVSQNRPMSHSKIAQYMGLPRSSIIRRVKALEGAGQVYYSPDGHVLCTHEEDSPELVKLTKELEGLIHRAASTLSRVDTKGIARGAPGDLRISPTKTQRGA